ncbi:MAG: LOG family protein, partial [Deferrisomatales bacterium]
VGSAVARGGGVVVCGGLSGVMAGACQGAWEAGGLAVAVLPGAEPRDANPWAGVVVATGLGHARNAVLVQSGDAVVALPGSWGTLSEIALALKTGRPVVCCGAWGEVEGVRLADSPEEAAALALTLAGGRP